MRKEVEYEEPITEVVVVGNKIKKELVEYCDVCKVPRNIYVEMKSDPMGKSVPTGRESVCKIFGHYTTKSNSFHKCKQCGKHICSKCVGNKYIVCKDEDMIYDEFCLCKDCNSYPSDSIKEIILLIQKKQDLEKEINKIIGETIDKFQNLKA
jgi:hypothetical protein